MAAIDTVQESSGGGTTNVGRIEEIQGVVVEVSFAENLPEINSALTIASRWAEARN